MTATWAWMNRIRLRTMFKPVPLGGYSDSGEARGGWTRLQGAHKDEYQHQWLFLLLNQLWNMSRIGQKLINIVAQGRLRHVANQLPYSGRIGDWVYSKSYPEGEVEADAQGHSIWLNLSGGGSPIAKAIHAKGYYEKGTTEFVKQRVSQGDRVADLGANIGYYTVLFAAIVGPSGTVYSAEPEPSNLRLLKRTIETNGFTNVNVIEAAVSNEAGTVPLSISSENEGDHRIVSKPTNGDEIEVNTVRLDDVIDGPLNFVKMDIQGAEPLALEGMWNLLIEHHPTIVLEIEQSIWDVAPTDVLEKLADEGYQAHSIQKDGSLSPISTERAAAIDERNIALIH